MLFYDDGLRVTTMEGLMAFMQSTLDSQYLLFLNVDSLVLLLGISGSVRSVYPALFMMPPSIYFSLIVFSSQIFIMDFTNFFS